MAAFDVFRSLVLANYWRLTRAMLLGVRGLIVDGDQKVLLIRHSYTSGWHLPGGGVERGETLRRALDRELAEEALVEVTAEPELFAIYSNEAVLRGDHVALYVIASWRSVGPFKPNAEIAGHGFFPLDDLPADITAGTQRRLDEVFAGAALSRTW